MPSKKIVCLGAGSYYFANFLSELAATHGLAGSEVALYDLDPEKSCLMETHGTRLTQQAGTNMRVRACTSLADAVDGADFAVSAIGGSGASLGGVYSTGVHNADVMIPSKYGIYQIVGDTGGPAGMMMGLRSITVYLEICREMEKRCPNVTLINHSNPMAILCRAIRKYSNIRNIIGICHGVQIGICQTAELLGVEPEELETTWIGTNHYYWFTRIYLHGKDVYPEVMAKAAARSAHHGEQMTQLLSQAYGHRIVYQEDGHVLEFYPFLAQVRSPEELPYGYAEEARQRFTLNTAQTTEPTRAESLAEFEQKLNSYALPTGPVSLMHGEAVPSLIEAIVTGRRDIRIVNIPNEGVVSNLPDHAILELDGVTDSCGVRGIHVGEAPISLMGLLQKRIAWQELVVDAGMKGDRKLALQALLLDEMAIPPEKASAMLDELLSASQDLLPQF